MGFSVTAAHVIFFVALLSAASAATSSYWTTASYMEQARRTDLELADRLVHGEMTVVVSGCTGSCNQGTRQVTLDITNSGTTVLDYRNLSYVLDGRAYTVADVSSMSITAPAAVSSTNVVLPGETLRVVLPNVVLSQNYSTTTLPVQVVSEEGVVGRR
jgi:archaellum component FlaF (FlaF/FlaG flagellin family)